MAHDVFISYSSRNKPVADAVCAGLEAEGIRCWIAPRDVLPGQNYGESIVHSIAACKVMVLVFSEATNVSQAVIREAERAMHHSKPIIPFRIEDVPMSPGLEFFLASCHWLDALTPPLDQHISQLALSVKRLTGENPVRRADGTPPAPVVVPPARGSRRPWWIAAVFVVALAALFAAWPRGKPASSPSPAVTTDPKPAIHLGVSLAGAGTRVIAGHFSDEDAPRYLASESNGLLTIDAKGGPDPARLTVVRPADAKRWFDFPPLDLDLKLLHQGGRTVFLQRALLKVKSSRPVKGSSWLVDGTRLDKVFALQAAGDAVEEAPMLSLGIAGPEDETDPARLPAPKAIAGNRAGAFEFPLPRGPKPGIEEVLFGTLNGVSFEIPFKALPAARSHSAARTPGSLYQIELRSEGADYEVACDLSQSLQAGEGDRFLLRLQCPVAAEHAFTLILEYDDGSGTTGRIPGPEILATILPDR